MGSLASEIDLRLRDEQAREFGTLKLELTATTPTGPLTRLGAPLVMQLPSAWMVTFIPLQGPGLIIERVGRYFVVHKRGDEEEVVGEFYCALVEPIPLSPERIAAIKANPYATKAVRAEFGCKFCSPKLRVYAGLERISSLETEGYSWYGEIPDIFECDCGKTHLDVSTVKRNFFALLGHETSSSSSEVKYLPLYERSSLESLRVEFLELLKNSRAEETVQKFIEANPVLLHQFPAEKILFKPSILTKFKADFAIVTPQKELVLIEIEPPGTRLLKKDGGQAAPLRHAFDQVHEWLDVVNDHKLAVLDSLDIARDAVSKVRGVVIAGRDAGNDAAYLRRLKGLDQGPVTMLTYDDLATGLLSLAESLRAL